MDSQDHRPPKIEAILHAIKLIHGGDPEGNIAFARAEKMPDGTKKMRNVASVQVKSAASMLPGILEQLAVDSYWTLNPQDEPRCIGGRRYPSLRGTELTRSAGVAWVDMDPYNLDPPRDIFGVTSELYAMHEAGYIPAPSGQIDSGRGVWAFWRFARPAQLKDPDVYNLYHETLRRLAGLLAHLGADRKATDVCRIARVPDSLHSKAQRRAKYIFAFDEDGDLINHDFMAFVRTIETTCNEIRQIDGVEPLPMLPRWTPAQRRITTGPAQTGGEPLTVGSLLPPALDQPKGRIAKRALLTLKELCLVVETRGGVPANSYRHEFLRSCAGCLRALGYTGADMRQRIADLNAKACIVPQTPPEVADACKNPLYYMLVPIEHSNHRRPMYIPGREFADRLGVTDDEARTLHLHVVVPEATATRRTNAKIVTQAHREASLMERQRRLSLMIADHNPTFAFPSLRKIAKDVFTANGLPASHQTVANDLKSMGYCISKLGELTRLY